jgi:hypothetical protein
MKALFRAVLTDAGAAARLALKLATERGIPSSKS